MRAYVGPYPSYLGPYQLAEKILFWKDKNKINESDPAKSHPDADDVDRLGDRLAEIKWLTRLLDWIDSKKKKRLVYVKIDGYDTWSADHTIALVVYPMLLKLRESKHGSPHVDDEDVPEHLRSTAAPMLSDEEISRGQSDDNYHARWSYVLDEMTWAFEQHAKGDHEDQFYTGDSDFSIVDGLLVTGPNHTLKVDYEGLEAHRERTLRGRMLFAKYYESLWS